MKHTRFRIFPLLALILAVVMLLTLVGCGDKSEDSAKSSDKKTTVTTSTTTTAAESDGTTTGTDAADTTTVGTEAPTTGTTAGDTLVSDKTTTATKKPTATTAKPTGATTSSAPTTFTPSTTSTIPVTPPQPTTAEVGETHTAGGLGTWKTERIQAVYGEYPEDSWPVKAFRSYDELAEFLTAYGGDDRYLKRADFVKFDAKWFEENALIMTYYMDGSCSVNPKIASYTYSEEGATLCVNFDVYVPSVCDAAVGGWHMFADIKKSDLDGVVKLIASVRARIPENDYVALFTAPTKQPQKAAEQWRQWLPDREGRNLSVLISQWNSSDLWENVTRSCDYIAAIDSNGHTHYVSADYAALQRDDGKLYWLTKSDAALIQRVIEIAGQQNTP